MLHSWFDQCKTSAKDSAIQKTLDFVSPAGANWPTKQEKIILKSHRFLFLTLLILSLISGQSSAAIYETNPPVLNKQEFAYLNQYVGKFILRTARSGENGATEDQFKSCTATLIAPTWILTAAHCLRRELGVPVRQISETRFRIYHDATDGNDYTSYHLTGRTKMGDYPNAKHQDWAFFELAEPILHQTYPQILQTNQQIWKSLNGAVSFIGFLKFAPDGQAANTFSSRQVRTSKFMCETAPFNESLFVAYPDFVLNKGIIEANNALFGTSNCPSTVTASGAPLIDTKGNIRAIDSFGSDNNRTKYFGEHKVNIYILAASFFEAYTKIMLETAAEQQPQISTSSSSTAITTSNLNVRLGPGTNFSIAGSLSNHQEVTLNRCNESSTWCHIQYANGQGWVSAQYLTLNP